MFTVVQAVGNVLDGDDKLGFARAPFPETMLVVRQYVEFFKVCDDCPVYDMFKYFAADRC